MDNYYFFFDRSAVDSLWSLSWQEFLRLYGSSRWAKGARLLPHLFTPYLDLAQFPSVLADEVCF